MNTNTLVRDEKKTGMTKQEAIQAMKEGKKVAHRYFSQGEWMKMVGKGFEFEDGVQCDQDYFWMDRNDKYWETDWHIVEEATL